MALGASTHSSGATARRTFCFRAPTALSRPRRQHLLQRPKATEPARYRRYKALPGDCDSNGVLVSPAGSDKIVRPRLAAPLFPMHTFYQLGLQQQLLQITPDTSDLAQSAAALSSPRRRRIRRRASQELTQEAGAYRIAWMVMSF
ncbi:hypothetical protein TrVFT333_011352 [Trichoderma virens FT-333]|nr:hypothetical protein TrVFT333_011352 [Trichoderma virens FT-333]